MIRIYLWLFSPEMFLIYQVLSSGQTFGLDNLSEPLTPFQLTFSPAHVVKGVTHDVTLQCAHEGSYRSQLHAVSRIRLLKKSPSRWELLAELRDNEAEPFSELSVPVTARISSWVPNTFLRVHWPVATEETFGTYRCDVIGFERNTYSHAAEVTTEIQLLEENVTTSDMLEIFGETKDEMQHIEDGSAKLKENVASLNNSVVALSNNVNLQTQDITALHESLNSVDENLTVFKSELNTLHTDMNSLEENFLAVSSDTHFLLKEVGSLKTELEAEKLTRTENVSITSSADGSGSTISSVVSRAADDSTSANYLNILLGWPKGQYALLQPKAGCPVDLTFLGSNSFIRVPSQSISVSSSNVSHSSALPLWTTSSIGSDKFFTLAFCEANGAFNTRQWPDGSYCVHRLFNQKCPNGLFLASRGIRNIHSNDIEDYRSRAVFGQNINNLCCRYTGTVDLAMELPTHSPFFLYSYHNKPCQQVKGMAVSAETLSVRNKADSSSDNIKLCYYTKF